MGDKSSSGATDMTAASLAASGNRSSTSTSSNGSGSGSGSGTCDTNIKHSPSLLAPQPPPDEDDEDGSLSSSASTPEAEGDAEHGAGAGVGSGADPGTGAHELPHTQRRKGGRKPVSSGFGCDITFPRSSASFSHVLLSCLSLLSICATMSCLCQSARLMDRPTRALL